MTEYQSAHLIVHPILGVHMYMVALSTTDDLPPNVNHKGHLVENMEQAFAIASKYNVPLYDGGEQLLEGNFQ